MPLFKTLTLEKEKMSLSKELFESALGFDELSDNVLDVMSEEQKDNVKNERARVFVVEFEHDVYTGVTSIRNPSSIISSILSGMESSLLYKDSDSLFIKDSDRISVSSSSTPAITSSTKKNKKKLKKKKQRTERIIPRKQKCVAYRQSKGGHR